MADIDKLTHEYVAATLELASLKARAREAAYAAVEQQERMVLSLKRDVAIGMGVNTFGLVSSLLGAWVYIDTAWVIVIESFLASWFIMQLITWGRYWLEARQCAALVREARKSADKAFSA